MIAGLSKAVTLLFSEGNSHDLLLPAGLCKPAKEQGVPESEDRAANHYAGQIPPG
jgi:hypothetical protein